MCVADQDVPTQAFSAARHQPLAEWVCSSSAINNSECSSFRPHLDTRGISSV